VNSALKILLFKDKQFLKLEEAATNGWQEGRETRLHEQLQK